MCLQCCIYSVFTHVACTQIHIQVLFHESVSPAPYIDPLPINGMGSPLSYCITCHVPIHVSVNTNTPTSMYTAKV